MALEWNGPPVPNRNRRAGKILRFDNLNDPDITPTGFKPQFNRRRLPRRRASGPRLLGPGDQAALEARIEQLAYGEILPDDLSEVRAVWWNLARQGVRLPTQPGVILIHGGVDG